jgi:hypothetical protein
MLDYQVPVGVIHTVIKISYRNLHTPVFLVVHFDMPMDSDWAHMAGTLHQR